MHIPLFPCCLSRRVPSKFAKVASSASRIDRTFWKKYEVPFIASYALKLVLVLKLSSVPSVQSPTALTVTVRDSDTSAVQIAADTPSAVTLTVPVPFASAVTTPPSLTESKSGSGSHSSRFSSNAYSGSILYRKRCRLARIQAAFPAIR